MIRWLVIGIFLFISSCNPVQFSSKMDLNSVTGQSDNASSGGGRPVHWSFTVEPADNQVDILLVIDDSNSMYSDNQKLASRLSGFVSSLSTAGINWQMCVTTTRANFYHGGSIYWYRNADQDQDIGSAVLNSSVSGLSTVFFETVKRIGAGWADSDDERGIAAMNLHLRGRSTNGCYRDAAALAVILISDEDERSVGGNSSQVYYPNEFQYLDPEDYPTTYLNEVKKAWGGSKRFTVNSIIVKPNDKVCMSQQDSSGAKSHYGHVYAALSQATDGYIGSICDEDFSQNLKYFKNKIQNSLSRATLECEPVGTIHVEVTPSIGTVKTRREGFSLIFEPAITEGHTVKMTYSCP